MKKRILSLAMALAVCLGLTVPAFAANSGFDIKNGYLSKYTGPGGDVVVPSGVTGIDYAAFQGCENVTSITIPDSVEFIDYNVFYGCINLNNIYFKGTKEQWQMMMDTVGLEFDGEFLLDFVPSIKVHFNSNGPSTPTQPVTPTQPTIPAKDMAKASTQSVTVDGKAVEFQMYALLDANGNGTNYIKLRDMAYVLNGTDAQFSVGYDNSTKTITVTTGQAYSAAGGEMTTPFSGDRSYTGGAQTLQINGKAVDMTAITLLDDQGGGYNYFKLRDLGAALGFNVGWSKEAGVFIESDKPYAG